MCAERQNWYSKISWAVAERWVEKLAGQCQEKIGGILLGKNRSVVVGKIDGVVVEIEGAVVVGNW